MNTTIFARFATILGLLATTPAILQAQGGSWATRFDVSAGLFAPASEVGTYDVTRAKLRSSPSLSIAVNAGRAKGRFGIRGSATVGIARGTRFRPTTSCQSSCRAFSIDAGRFLGAALDVVARHGTSVQFGLGPAVLRYDYGSGQGFLGQCQAGAMCDDPFRKGSTKLAVHWGGALIRRMKGMSVFIAIEDYVSHRSSGGIQNDLNVAVGAGVGRF